MGTWAESEVQWYCDLGSSCLCTEVVIELPF